MRVTVFKKIEAIIAIPFVDEEITTASVCFACSDELRADFRIQFSAFDVVNYVYGIIQDCYTIEEIKTTSILDFKIPYPQNAAFFWNYSFIGEKNRFKFTIKEINFIDLNELNWIKND